MTQSWLRAQTEGRIVVTHDKDFGELAFRAQLPASCGVILFRLSGSEPETDNRRILELLESRGRLGGTLLGRHRRPDSQCGFCRVPHRRRRGHDRRAGLPPDYRKSTVKRDALRWHSNHRVFGDLLPGDRLWVITSGKSLGRPDQSAGYLVGMWPVAAVIENPGDDPDYPAPKYQHRVLISETEAIHLDEPICVDHLIRGEGYDNQIPIGRFLRGPRRLTDEKVRQLGLLLGRRWRRNG